MLFGRPFLLPLNETLTEHSRERHGHLLPDRDSILQAQIQRFPVFFAHLVDAFHNCCCCLPDFFSFAGWREVLIDLQLFNGPLLLSRFDQVAGTMVWRARAFTIWWEFTVWWASSLWLHWRTWWCGQINVFRA